MVYRKITKAVNISRQGSLDRFPRNAIRRGGKPMREIYTNHNAWGITIARCPSWIYKRRPGRPRHILISGMPVELPGITLQIHTYLFASAPAVSINVARILSPFVACTSYNWLLALPVPTSVNERLIANSHSLSLLVSPFSRLSSLWNLGWKPSVPVLLSFALENFQLSSDPWTRVRGSDGDRLLEFSFSNKAIAKDDYNMEMVVPMTRCFRSSFTNERPHRRLNNIFDSFGIVCWVCF